MWYGRTKFSPNKGAEPKKRGCRAESSAQTRVPLPPPAVERRRASRRRPLGHRPPVMASSRPLLRRLAALVYGRVRANQRLRLLTSTPERASPPPSLAEPEPVRMTEGCVRRLKELQAKEPSAEGKMLRVSVEAGGCSGFQYSFSLDNKKSSDDRIFEKDGVKLVVDDISYDFVKGATVDYEEELIRSAFVVSTNPSAVGGCSCKSSFMVK